MSDELTQPEKPLDELRNYYPEIHDNLKDDFRVLTIKYFSGKESVTLAPKKWWLKAEAERKRLIDRVPRLYKVSRCFDPVKLADPESRKVVATVLESHVGGVIFLNLYWIFTLKVTAESGTDSVRVETIGDDDGVIATSREEADSLFNKATARYVINKLKAELIDKFISASSWYIKGEGLIEFLWGQVIFCALLALEEDHGPVNGMDTERFDSLFWQYERSNFCDAIGQACTFCAEGIARDYLEWMNPSEWPVEDLMEFLNIRIVPDDDFGIGKMRMSRQGIEKLIKQAVKADRSTPDVRYDIRDGKTLLKIATPTCKIEMEVDSKIVDLKEMSAAGLLESYAKHSRNFAWDQAKTKTFGEYYVKYYFLLEDHAKRLLRTYPDNWRDMFKHIDMNMPKGFYAYLPDLISQGGHDTSELALQIAACKTDPTYLKASEGKFADSEKTWPLSCRELFRRLLDEYKIKSDKSKSKWASPEPNLRQN
jgi:hypothetical protein